MPYLEWIAQDRSKRLAPGWLERIHAIQAQSSHGIQAKRDLLPFQEGDNSTDVVINGRHYNLTTLLEYEFAVYSNGTMSNSTYCYLTLPSAAGNMPTIFPNGSITNGSSCYVPYYPIGQRGSIGIAFATLFAVSIMFTLVCLRKHGQLFLPQSKRFRAVGRRWQWYWALFIATCGMISCFSAVDVDRYYLPSSPIVIQTLFWYLMIPGVLACVWESVRHWGSWQERQAYDADPFLYKNHDRRSKVEFYLPLIFYLFAWLNFFMNIPRNWLNFQAQADPAQISNSFIPTTHDVRFKAGAILAFCAWCIIPLHLWHSIHYYKPEARSSTFGGLRSIPVTFFVTIPLALVVVGYAEASAWIPFINLGGVTANSGWIYGLGFAPVVLIIFLNVVSALRNPNEDLELIRQRAIRGQASDAMLGINRRNTKPRWWTQTVNDFGFDNDAKLRALANTNVGYNRNNNEDRERDIQMHNLARQHLDDEIEPVQRTERPFTDAPAVRGNVPRRDGLLDVTSPPARSNVARENSYAASVSSDATTVSQARPQQVRSMLDV